MKLQLVKATTSQTALIFVQDSSATTGAGLTGLAFNTGSLSWFYYREAAGTGGTAVTLATQTIGTWVSGGFVELDATDMPGWYEIGIPDACLATGADFVGMVLKGATNMAQVNIEIQLTGLDLNASSDVLTQVNAALDAAIPELGVGSPSATPSLRNAAMLLYMATRNLHKLQTSGTDAWEIHNDAGTMICSGAATDAGGDLAIAKLA